MNIKLFNLVSAMHALAFVLIFYLIWFGSLFLASCSLPYLALILSIALSAVELAFFCNLQSVQKSWKKFFLCLTFIGFSVDSLLSFSSFIHFYANPWQPYLAPPWLLGIWINFSVLGLAIAPVIVQFHHYLWLFTLMAFPTAYLAGVSFHVAFLTQGTYSCLLFGLIWMFLFPLICHSTLNE